MAEVKFLHETDCSQWEFTHAKRPKDSVTFNSYVNTSSTCRDNPMFQLPCKLRVKHDPSPGWNKSRVDLPYARCNIELGVPRGLTAIHDWFANWDKSGIRHTYENQELVWPNKRPKSLEDIVPEGLFRPSIPDSQKLIDNDWDPSLRLKAVPEGPPEKPNKKVSRIYVQNPDGSVREGTIDDICKGDDVVAIVEVEGWYGSKDSSGYTYRIYECMVYKANQRPSGPTLRSLDSDGPLLKPSDDSSGGYVTSAAAPNAKRARDVEMSGGGGGAAVVADTAEDKADLAIAAAAADATHGSAQDVFDSGNPDDDNFVVDEDGF